MSITSYIETFAYSPLSRWNSLEPWELTTSASQYVRELLGSLPNHEFIISNEIAVHVSATIENGAILKGPIIIGPNCFVASSAYIRGGNWLEADCILGPGVELKSSFLFGGTKLAHFNFVGDSILGRDVNLEAGSIIANYRNEYINKEIHVIRTNELIHTGVQKFGALIGDHCRIGANAVIAPGSLMLPKTLLKRLSLFDDERVKIEKMQGLN